MLVNNKVFKEVASRGVSQKRWDSMKEDERKVYLKENPTSRYAEKIKKPIRNLEQELDDLRNSSNREIKSLRDENVELRQRLEALERFIKGVNPNLTSSQQKQVAKELEEKLSPEYTEKVNGILDALEDEYDSTLDDAIFGLLDAFPELQDKFISNGDIDGIKSIPSKADKLELLAQMLKSLRKEDLDKVLKKIGANKESKDDMEIMKEAYFKKFPNKKMKDFKEYIHPYQFYHNDGDWTSDYLDGIDYPEEDNLYLINENGDITDNDIYSVADEFLGTIRQFDLMTGMNISDCLEKGIDNDDPTINGCCLEPTDHIDIPIYDRKNLEKDLEKFKGSPLYQKFSEKYNLNLDYDEDISDTLMLLPINDGGLDKYAEKYRNAGSKDYKYQELTPEMRNAINKCLSKDSKIIENKDGSYDIEGDINFDNMRNEDFNKLFIDNNGYLKIKFNKVSGDFIFPPYCSIKTLEGSPKKVGGSFVFDHCENLKNLEGAPEQVGDNFNCENCENLESLKGAPKKVGGAFMCMRCDNLKELDCDNMIVGGIFECYDTLKLKDYSKFPKQVGGVILEYDAFNKGTSFLNNTKVTSPNDFHILFGYENGDYSKMRELYDNTKIDKDKINKEIKKIENKPCYKKLANELFDKYGIEPEFELLGYTY